MKTKLDIMPEIVKNVRDIHEELCNIEEKLMDVPVEFLEEDEYFEERENLMSAIYNIQCAYLCLNKIIFFDLVTEPNEKE